MTRACTEKERNEDRSRDAAQRIAVQLPPTWWQAGSASWSEYRLWAIRWAGVQAVRCNGQLGCAGPRRWTAGCEPYGDGGPIVVDFKGKPGGGIEQCPRKGVMCIDLWDPVICDDGQVYSNDCYAWVACATGCEPYGDGGPIVVELKGTPGGGNEQ